eukprot:gene10605-3123_t
MSKQQIFFSSKPYSIPKKNFENLTAEKLKINLNLLNFDEKQGDIIYPKVKINVKVKSLFDTNKPFPLYVNELFEELELKKVLYEKSKKYQFYDIVCLHTQNTTPFKKIENIFELLEEKDILQTINNEEIFEIWLRRNYIGTLIIFLSYFTVFNLVLYVYLTIL